MLAGTLIGKVLWPSVRTLVWTIAVSKNPIVSKTMAIEVTISVSLNPFLASKNGARIRPVRRARTTIIAIESRDTPKPSAKLTTTIIK